MSKFIIIDSGFGYGGLDIEKNRVRRCAPIFRKWFMGKSESEVVKILRYKKWKYYEISDNRS